MFKKWFGFAGCKPSKQNPSPFTVSSRTLRWRAKKWFYKSLNGSRIIHRWIPKIGDDDVVFEMKIQDELIVLLPAANRKWCGVKIGVTGGSEPANNYASQEDYLGYRRRQREECWGVTPSPGTNSEWVAWRFDCQSNSFPSPCRLSVPRKSLSGGGLTVDRFECNDVTFGIRSLFWFRCLSYCSHGSGTILIC